MSRGYRALFVFGFQLGLILGAVNVARADSDEYRTIYRGTRSMGMGGAFVGVADDEEALYINPAGLAQIKKPEINLLPLMIEANQDLVLMTYGILFSGSNPFSQPIGLNSLSQFQGQSYYVRSQLTPSFVMPGFGISLLVDQQVGFQLQNPYFPQMNTIFQTTDGIQAGVGFSVYRSRGGRDEIDVGAAAKVMWRRGGYRSLSGFQLLSALGQSYNSLVNNIYGGFGTGYGVDGGVLYTHKFKSKISVKVGASMTDIGDTSFTGGNSDPMKSNTTLGASLNFKVGDFKGTLAYDYAHAFDDGDWRKKNHLGLELAIPILSLYGGIYEVFPSFGLAVDVWLFRFSAISYTEETGEYVFQNPQARYLAEVMLKIPL